MLKKVYHKAQEQLHAARKTAVVSASFSELAAGNRSLGNYS
jgi:hypothetical protein